MNIAKMNQHLTDVKLKLESLDPKNKALAEAQKKPSEHSPNRRAASKKVLQRMYDKLTAGRSDATKVKSTGAKR